VLIGAVPPLMLKTAANPGGMPIEAFDGIRAGVLADRSQFFKDLTEPFYGANRPNAKVSEGVKDFFWLQGMMGGFKGATLKVSGLRPRDVHDAQGRDQRRPAGVSQGDPSGGRLTSDERRTIDGEAGFSPA
jgi:hypothetical protein